MTKEQRDELIDAIAETLQDTVDMDVPWSRYAENVFDLLEKHGVLNGADTTKVCEGLVDTALNDNAMAHMKKKLQGLTDDLYDYIEYSLKDDLAGNLSSLVRQMSDNVIEQLLAGNEDQMRRYLHCDLGGYDGRDNMDRFIVMHGMLYEHSPIILRRKIVEAFPDLIRNERITDLEAQVAALVKEMNRVEADKERMRRHYQGQDQ